MTYVTLDVWEKCCKGLDQYEYAELYSRGILPTNLMPRIPSKYYADHNTKRSSHNKKILKIFEEKCGRKYNTKSKDDQRLYRKIYNSFPEVTTRIKEYNQRPDVLARRAKQTKKRRQKK